MKIGTRLMLSYIGLIIFIIVGVLLLVDWVVDLMFRKNYEEAQIAVRSLTQAELKFSQEVLTKRSKRLVELKAGEVASQVALMIAKKGTLDYDKLRKDQKLRKIATQDIVFDGEVVGYTDMMDSNGVVVLHVNKDFEGKNYADWKDQYPDLWQLVQKSIAQKEVTGEFTFLNRENRPERKFLASEHVLGTPFIVGAIIEIEKTFLPTHEKIKREHQRILKETQTSIERHAELSLYQAKFVGLIGASLVSFLGICFGFWLTGSLARPILRLRNAVKQLGEGKFSTEVKEEGSKEIRQLAQSFNMLGHKLTEYTENLAKATADRQRMESELTIAEEMQKSLLPVGLNPFPNRKEFELRAVMKPARHVGGDFYNFFFLDKDHLYFVIGDVCGKGIPAAMLMAVTKSLIETGSLIAFDPGELVSKLNSKLAENNEKAVFVTIFCGMLNVMTGDLAYVNAGHESPFLIKKGKDVSTVASPTGPAVGLYEEEVFRTEHGKLETGDMLFAFTDGVTEAVGESDRFFTRERLATELEQRAGNSVQELVDGMMEELALFTEGSPQTDDLTMLAIKRLN